MKLFHRCLPVCAALVLLTGCSTPADRIPKHQAAFDSWPADIRENVRAGRVAVGYMPEMVAVALGEPDRVITSVAAKGGPVEVWVYLDQSPSWSIGVGVGGGNGSTAIGTSVGISDGNWGPNEKMRVVFEAGRVIAIEQRRK